MQAVMAFLRRHGVRVVEIGGWQTRGVPLAFAPRFFVCHWDASTLRSGEWGALGIIVAGRGGANPVPPPLAQTQVARCLDGVPKVAIVAAGRANQAGRGGPYRLPDGTTIPLDSANRYSYGSEHANDGSGEPVTPASMHAYQTLAAAYREVLGMEVHGRTLDRGAVVAHCEWAPHRKDDPRTYIGTIRVGSDRVLTETMPAFAPAPPPTGDDEMAGVGDEILTKLDDIYRLVTVGDGADVPPGKDTHANSLKVIRAKIAELSDALAVISTEVSRLGALLDSQR
jgi:hypothetical protein